jgi:hypothetical protein
MRARTSTVLGLILLLAATPVHPARAVPPPPPAMRVFVGTTTLRSTAHRVLTAGRPAQQAAAAGAAQSQALLAAVLPLFGPDLLRAFGGAPLLAAYVPAAVLGTLPHVAIGSGEALAWSPYCPSPGRHLLDLVMARERVPALVLGEGGLHAADLRISTADLFDEGPVFVTDVNLRGRNVPADELGIDPPALAVVGIGLVCLAPTSRRVRSSARLPPMRRLMPMRRVRVHRR